MKKALLISVFTFLLGKLVFGQDSVLLTKNFRFAVGVYYNLAQLQANKPAFGLDTLEVQYFTNPQTSLTQLNSLIFKESKQTLPLDSVWVVCLDGVPSIRIPDDEIDRELPNFAAFKLRGKICYFTYPDYRKKTIRVAAYNPRTGRPFRQGNVVRDEEVIVKKMLHFQTGETADFSDENLLAWIQDDPILVETLAELPPEQLDEKLFKSLLIYVDRNPFYLMTKDEK